MFKYLLILLLPLSLNATHPYQSDDLLKACRSLIDKAFADKNIADSLYQGLQHEDGSNNLLYGYRGAVEMSFGKHESGLIKKGRYFSSGKEILEQAIANDSDNIELIFLRYTIQYNVPGFLGYSSKLEEDRAKLEKAVKTRNDLGSLRASIKKFLEKNQPE